MKLLQTIRECSNSNSCGFNFRLNGIWYNWLYSNNIRDSNLTQTKVSFFNIMINSYNKNLYKLIFSYSLFNL